MATYYYFQVKYEKKIIWGKSLLLITNKINKDV